MVEQHCWTKELLLLHQQNAIDAECSTDSLERLLLSVADIRHTALRRIPTDSEGMKKFLVDSEAFARLLQDQERLGIVTKLRQDAELAFEDLDRKKERLLSQLEENRLRIATERAKLDRMEREAIKMMTEKRIKSTRG